MKRDEVMTLVREHLVEELEIDAAQIEEGTRFKEDLDADSLDLYELVMELEDHYGISVSEEQAARDQDGRRRGRLRAGARARLRRMAWAPTSSPRSSPSPGCIDGLPARPARARPSRTRPGPTTAGTPTSGSPSSATASSASRSPPRSSPATRASTPARLTKIHNQAVSQVSCAEVGRELGVAEMLAAGEPGRSPSGIPAETLLAGRAPAPRGHRGPDRRLLPRPRLRARPPPPSRPPSGPGSPSRSGPASTSSPPSRSSSPGAAPA